MTPRNPVRELLADFLCDQGDADALLAVLDAAGITLVPKEPTMMIIVVKQDKSGLWFATSPDEKGLLVAEHSFDEAVHAVPRALADLRRAKESVHNVP